MHLYVVNFHVNKWCKGLSVNILKYFSVNCKKKILEAPAWRGSLPFRMGAVGLGCPRLGIPEKLEIPRRKPVEYEVNNRARNPIGPSSKLLYIDE